MEDQRAGKGNYTVQAGKFFYGPFDNSELAAVVVDFVFNSPYPDFIWVKDGKGGIEIVEVRIVCIYPDNPISEMKDLEELLALTTQ